MAQRGRPKENGRTTKLVRIPVEWDIQEMIDIYALMHQHADIQITAKSRGENNTRDWTHYNRLMEEVIGIIIH